jgi:hypothetical protein
MPYFQPGAGGVFADDGADAPACGALTSFGGGGGAPSGGTGSNGLAGGGGGANGGAGGAGTFGLRDASVWLGADGGLSEPGPAAGEPLTSGGGGGGAGQVFPAQNEDDFYCDDYGGGSGAGFLRIEAASFETRGRVQAAGGATGMLRFNPSWPVAGGPGGGAGGTLVFRVDRFFNAGVVDASGSAGGTGNPGNFWDPANCALTAPGIGGGGGGGRVFILGRDGGALGQVDGGLALGTVLVAGGPAVVNGCGATGKPGQPGWVWAP